VSDQLNNRQASLTSTLDRFDETEIQNKISKHMNKWW